MGTQVQSVRTNSERAAIQRVAQALEAARDRIAAVMPKCLTPDRLFRVAMATIYRTPRLAQCTTESLVAAVHAAAELGLEPNGAIAHGYLIPRRNGKASKQAGCDVYEAQFLVGYLGLVELARRSGQVSSIYARVVFENDPMFRVVQGTNERLEHVPLLAGERGKPIAVYAVAHLKDGSQVFEVMNVADVEKIRQRSQSPEEGPWVTDWEAMAKKTVLRRLCRMLPLSVEMRRAFELDEDADRPEDVDQMRLAAKTQQRLAELRSRVDAIQVSSQTAPQELPATEDQIEEARR